MLLTLRDHILLFFFMKFFMKSVTPIPKYTVWHRKLNLARVTINTNANNLSYFSSESQTEKEAEREVERDENIYFDNNCSNILKRDTCILKHWAYYPVLRSNCVLKTKANKPYGILHFMKNNVKHQNRMRDICVSDRNISKTHLIECW